MASQLSRMFIGVDIGTGSARACLMDDAGEIIALASRDIQRWEPKPDHINQSSSDIWNAICYCTNKIIIDSKVDVSKVQGIAFDATCSLVLVDKDLNPISAGPDWSNKDQNVILWMDHRAAEETDLIAATKASLLKYVGGAMSIEMEMPKALWLKKNMDPAEFDKTFFYDLADYLTCKSTGSSARSYCSTVCKQGFVPTGIDGSKDGWNAEFLNQIGLGDLTRDRFSKLGGVPNENGVFFSAGEAVGNLTAEAAKDLGLTTGVVVASGVIDAYSGWIGTVAAHTDGVLPDSEIEGRLAAVAGTSTCHIVVSKDPVFVPGVWGPYRDVLVPGMWAAEGGQSATGELLHHIITTNAAYPLLKAEVEASGLNQFDVLNRKLEEMRQEKGYSDVLHLAKHYFFYGDLYGNRSPIANPRMRGSITGIGRETTLESLAIAYLGAVEFICQQTRQIIEAMNKAGHNINSIYLSGGQCRNTLLTQLMADCTGYPLIIPKYIDAAVVLGTAILAATATNESWTLWDAMSKFSGNGTVVKPREDVSIKKLLDAKYSIFLDQAQRQQEYRASVDAALSN